MKKFLLFLSSVVLFAACNFQSDTTDPNEWNNPVSYCNPHSSWNRMRLFPTKVKFNEDETVLYLTVQGYPQDVFTFASGTFLRSGDATYPMTSIEGLVPGEYRPLNSNGKADLVLHFAPLPEGTQSFDLIESDNLPGAFNIWDIHRFNPSSLEIAKSHWRNKRTGEWVISFLEDQVIYDSKVWKCDSPIVSQSEDAISLKMTCNGQDAQLTVGNMKSGGRRIDVLSDGSHSSVLCEKFETHTLPDYPSKGKHRPFGNNNYFSQIDTVTISGLMKYTDGKSTYCKATIPDFFSGATADYSGKIDDAGLFTVSFPLMCSTDVMLEVNGQTIWTSVEPGESYFVYWNIDLGSAYFMGDNARLQNEKISIGYIPFNKPYIDQVQDSEFDFAAHLASLKNAREEFEKQLDTLKSLHPNLSDAFFDVEREYCSAVIYQSIEQSRFENVKGYYSLPDEMADYIAKDFKQFFKIPYRPLGFNYFSRGFVNCLSDRFNASRQINTMDLLKQMIDNPEYGFSDEDKLLFDEYFTVIDVLDSIEVNNEMNDSTASVLESLYNENIGVITKAEGLINQSALNADFSKILEDKVVDVCFNNVNKSLDSLGLSDINKDYFITLYFYDYLKNQFHSIPSERLEMYDRTVTSPLFRDKVHQLNDRYLAYETVGLANLGSVVTKEELANMTEGETIIKKLIEPYRGRIVYLDIWGSWCGACLYYLSQSSEMRDALKDYDIVYLYLANNTPDEKWGVVIKEYNLTADNCVHYNLPSEQQALVEEYLQVSAFPSYHLFNRNGTLIECECHPYDLNHLKGILDQL